MSKMNSQQLIRQVCANIDLYFSDILKVCNSLASDSDIKYHGNYFSTLGHKNNLSNIKLKFFNTATNRNDIDDVNMLYNGKILASSFNIYSNEELKKIAYYYDLGDIYLDSKIVPFSYKNTIGKDVFYAVKSVYLPDERKNFEAYVIISFYSDKLNDIFSRLKLGEGSFAYLADKYGKIQYSTSKANINEQSFKRLMDVNNFKKELTTIEKINNKEFLVSVNPLSNSDMFVVFAIPLQNITDMAQQIRIISLILIILCTIIAFIISVFFSSFFTKPLTGLVNCMNTIGEGNFLMPSKIEGSLEIKLLYIKFNEMVKKINRLMEDINEKNYQKRKAEIYALQSQMNPHFLYNTLDSINAMAILIGAKDIMKITTSLAKLFRLSINKVEEFITISDEINYVKSYMNIQKIRYKDKFDVHYEVEDEILDFKIVKLIIQPLVENAIYHGLETKEGKGTIIVKGVCAGENIRLIVIDDGIGIEKECLENINSSLNESEGYIKKRSIGIYNVNQRIKLYYGDDYGLKIDSQLNEGTNVEILIPKHKGEVS